MIRDPAHNEGHSSPPPTQNSGSSRISIRREPASEKHVQDHGSAPDPKGGLSVTPRQSTIREFKRYRGMMSSVSQEWGTPIEIFNGFNDQYDFTLDAAASTSNKKCDRYYTKEQDALAQPWDGRVWCNPPYTPRLGRWIEKGYLEYAQGRASVVAFLVPARTDTIWWHEYALKADEIHFCKGRIKFDGPSAKPGMRATFPSCVIIFRRHVNNVA